MAKSYLYRFTFTWIDCKSSFWSSDIDDIKKALLNFSVPEGRVIYSIEELENAPLEKVIKICFQQDAIITLDKIHS